MENSKQKFSLLNLPTQYMMLVVLIILCIALSIAKPAFHSTFNVSTLIRTISWTTIVAFGQTLVLLTGGIDLSVAGMAGMSGILSAFFMVNLGIPPIIVIPIVLALAFFCGCLNGLLITQLGMIPFIVTLATGQIFTGIIYVLTQGHPILGIPSSATILGQGMLFGRIPFPTIAMLLLCIALAYVMKFTPIGALIGGCFMGVVDNAITILAISAYWKQVITGIIIIIAIAIDCIKTKRQSNWR